MEYAFFSLTSILTIILTIYIINIVNTSILTLLILQEEIIINEDW